MQASTVYAVAAVLTRGPLQICSLKEQPLSLLSSGSSTMQAPPKSTQPIDYKAYFFKGFRPFALGTALILDLTILSITLEP